jgi:hypothetical protein
MEAFLRISAALLVFLGVVCAASAHLTQAQLLSVATNQLDPCERAIWRYDNTLTFFIAVMYLG